MHINVMEYEKKYLKLAADTATLVRALQLHGVTILAPTIVKAKIKSKVKELEEQLKEEIGKTIGIQKELFK